MTHRPANVPELQEAIATARAIRLRAGGTKSAPGPDDDVLDVTQLSGLVDYSPDECVLTARAGTPLREITKALAAHRQYLPFDPPFVDEGATIGGTVASGLSGPRRYRYGGVRDFVIGVRVVDGEGRVIRSGGRVVKNAAGFLLHHGMVGSCGRFGALAELTLKVFPAPEARRYLTIDAGSVESAFEMAQRIEQLRRDCEAIDFDERGELTVTIAGRAETVDSRAARLADALGPGTVPAIGDCPPARGLSPTLGTDPAWVKVAGLMTDWQKVRTRLAGARFMCAGAVAWAATADVAGLALALEDAHLTGQIIRGPSAGERIGHVVYNEFEERVRRVLDPHHRFSAASHPCR
jgi:glycolate oxidase FAD binding subunit